MERTSSIITEKKFIFKGLKVGDTVLAKEDIPHKLGFHMKKGTSGTIESFEEVYKWWSLNFKPEVYGKTEIHDKYIAVIKYNYQGKAVKTSITVYAKHDEIKLLRRAHEKKK